MVMTCFVPPYVTNMLAVNPPPVMARFMRPSASRPLTSPAALKVRSSHVPVRFSPRWRSWPRISISLLLFLHRSAIRNLCPPSLSRRCSACYRTVHPDTGSGRGLTKYRRADRMASPPTPWRHAQAPKPWPGSQRLHAQLSYSQPCRVCLRYHPA